MNDGRPQKFDDRRSSGNSVPHGIMFHHFHGGIHPQGQGSISAEDFSNLIEFLGPARILNAEDWLDHAVAGTLEPHHLCLTFDDGLLCQYDIAKPVMEKFGITGFWFVYSSAIEGGLERLEIYRHFRTTYFDDIDVFYKTFFSTASEFYSNLYATGLRAFNQDTFLSDFIFYTPNDRKFRYLRDFVLREEKYHKVMDRIISAFETSPKELGRTLWLDNERVKKLDQMGHCIGLHSFSHPTRMEDFSSDLQLEEYQKNFRHLSDLLGEVPQVMSHPCNSYSNETLRILRDLGIVLGFRSQMNPPTPDSMLEWPREDHTNVMSQFRLRA